MADGIIGFCRFSFLGVGDWVAYRSVRGGQELTPEILKPIADKLYDPKRLALRFWLFENLLLPSMKAQKDKDFTLVVLTSPEMPDVWLDRLRALVEGKPNLQLVVSPERSCKAALLPVLDAFRAKRQDQGYPVQFRIDDDDCLSTDYIRSLRKAANAMSGSTSFAVSMPRALVMMAYGNDAERYFQLYSLFHSAGCAYYTEDPTRTVFHYSHALFHKNVNSLILPGSTTAFMTKFDGHDGGERFERNQSRNWEEVSKPKLDTLLAKRFPFLQGIDFSQARQIAADAAA